VLWDAGIKDHGNGLPRLGVSAKRFAGLTTPSAPSLRSAQASLLCEEGNPVSGG